MTHSAPSADLVLDELEEGENGFVFALDSEALELEHEFFVFSSAVDTEVVVRRSINSFSLRGAVKWMLTGECYRCLEEIQELQQTKFELLLQRRQASEEEIASAEEDGFIEIIDPGTRRVDLADYVREAIVLEMPMRIPSQASGGDCPHCGKGEGLVECEAQQQTDPRWDALKKIEFS